MSVLPDVLQPGLRVVFCGTAVSNKSAEVKAYYAGPGNKFWKVIAEVGFTPMLLLPSQYTQLLDYNLGLTDLAKKKSGSDRSLAKDDYDRDELRSKILQYRPHWLCFNGKEAAKQFFQRKAVSFGIQNESVGETKLFIAPSTSGAACGSWDVTFWGQLAELSNEN